MQSSTGRDGIASATAGASAAVRSAARSAARTAQRFKVSPRRRGMSPDKARQRSAVPRLDPDRNPYGLRV